jgi:tRNA nucleotidyltransferase (CCA-adding enzyme)
MKEYLKKLPQELRDVLISAGELAHKQKARAYLVGGFVRDLLLGVDNLDLDIALEGDGIRFAEAFAKNTHAQVVCHKRFGTAKVNISPGLKVDIASTRKECYPRPASLPLVETGLLEDDLIRRDFTINTLAISLNRRDFGGLLDMFEGKRDIGHKVIRVLHDASFVDDPTRILRAIRFEQRYDFRIEPRTMACLRKALKLDMLNVVQPQRLRRELILILSEKDPWKPVKRMQGITGLDFIDPGLSLSKDAAGLFRSVGKQIDWFESNFPRHRRLDTWLIYLMALLEGAGKARIGRICGKFVFAKGEEKRIAGFCSSGPAILARLSRKKLLPSDVFHTLEELSYEVILLLKACARDKLARERIEDFFRKYNGTNLLVGGHHLKELGFVPGPHYQKIFDALLNAKLNGRLKDREDELEFLKNLKKNE